MTSATGRVQSIDVLRGITILGILVMNVRDFGLPLAWFERPGLAGGNGVGNVAAWALGGIVFQDKMIALLSLLFGAGLVLMTDRADAGTAGGAGRWYRRCAWLLLFGLLHALGLWYGDILNTYAIAGMLLFPVRRWEPRRLVLLAVLVLLVTVAVDYGPWLWDWCTAHVGSGARKEAAQEALAKLGRSLHPTISVPPMPPPDVSEELAVYHGSWWDTVRHHAGMFYAWHVRGVYRFNLWRCAGLMLLGMAFVRTGLFQATQSTDAERRLLRWGYGLGLPLVLLTLAALHLRILSREGSFDPARLGTAGTTFFGATLLARRGLAYIGAILVALGHLALILRWCRSMGAAKFRERLAAVGRMALTCYLVQTVLCVFFFYGYGLARFGRLSMAELWLVVVAIWLLQLWLCPLWLRRFEQGPMEWLWRSLVAGRRLPLRRERVIAQQTMQ